MDKDGVSQIPSPEYEEPPEPKSQSECSEEKKGAWSAQEDQVLLDQINAVGIDNWSEVAKGVEGRNGKSCRLRWHNQLNPDLRHTPFTPEEDLLIIEAHQSIGNRWSRISKLLRGRTDNAVKNRWNSSLAKRIHSKPKASSSLGKVARGQLSKYPGDSTFLRHSYPNGRLTMMRASGQEGLDVAAEGNAGNPRMSPDALPRVEALRFRDNPAEVQLDEMVHTSGHFWRRFAYNEQPPEYPSYAFPPERTRADLDRHFSAHESHRPIQRAQSTAYQRGAGLSPDHSTSSRHSLPGHLGNAFEALYEEGRGFASQIPQQLHHQDRLLPRQARSLPAIPLQPDAAWHRGHRHTPLYMAAPPLSPPTLQDSQHAGFLPLRMDSEPPMGAHFLPLAPTRDFEGGKVDYRGQMQHLSRNANSRAPTPTQGVQGHLPTDHHQGTAYPIGQPHKNIQPAISLPEKPLREPGLLDSSSNSFDPRSPVLTPAVPTTSGVLIGGECMTHADTGNDYPLGKPWQTSPPVKASGAMVAEDNMASIADMQPEDEAELEKMVLDMFGAESLGMDLVQPSMCASAFGNEHASRDICVHP